jgi:hypothetical protein
MKFPTGLANSGKGTDLRSSPVKDPLPSDEKCADCRHGFPYRFTFLTMECNPHEFSIQRLGEAGGRPPPPRAGGPARRGGQNKV